MKLDVADIPLSARGALKSKIKEVVQAVYEQAREKRLHEADNYVTRQELAEWLGEGPNDSMGNLRNRVQGFKLYATRRNCPACGKNAAAALREKHTHRAETPIATGEST